MQGAEPHAGAGLESCQAISLCDLGNATADVDRVRIYHEESYLIPISIVNVKITKLGY